VIFKGFQRFRKFILSYGPAIFMIGAVVGTGSVSSLVVAGADHGMSLLWALLLSCFFFWILLAAVSRVTFASGKTFISLANEHFGKAAGFYIVFAVTISQFTANIGVLGIISEAFASWTGVDFLLSAIFWSSIVYLIILMGKYSAFERILIVFVTVLGLSFFIDMFFAHPPAKVVFSGLIPSVPKGGSMIVGAMVGTTLAGSVVVMRSFVVKDKGWTMKNLKHAEKDSLASGVLIFVISAVVMATAAATLYVRGMHVDKAIDMAYTLVPLFGKFAATLFIIGIIAAGLSSAFPNTLVSVWSISDFFGLSRNPKALHFRLIALLYCAAGLIAPLFGGKPVLLQIMSLAIQAIFLPLLVLFLTILANKDAVVGKHKSTKFVNVMCVITFLFSLFMAYQAFSGLMNLARQV
jgi:manganese transport protein